MKGRAWCAHPNAFFTLMKKIMNILQFSHSDKEKKHNNKKQHITQGKRKRAQKLKIRGEMIKFDTTFKLS